MILVIGITLYSDMFSIILVSLKQLNNFEIFKNSNQIMLECS